MLRKELYNEVPSSYSYVVFFAYVRAFPEGIAAGLYFDSSGVQQTLERAVYAPLFYEEGCLIPKGFYFSNDVPALLYTQKDPESRSSFLDNIRKEKKLHKLLVL